MTAIGELLGASVHESEIDGAVLELQGDSGSALVAVPEDKITPLQDVVDALEEPYRGERRVQA